MCSVGSTASMGAARRMIVPKRFGLKYGPVPTIALEYEEDPAEGMTSTGLTSVYVHRAQQKDEQVSLTTTTKVLKKLHVVELPTLTKASESDKIVKELQENNKKFLSSSVIKEDQLKRLLDRLIEHLQVSLSSPKKNSNSNPVEEQEQQEEEEHEEESNVLDESVAKASIEKEDQEQEQPSAASSSSPVQTKSLQGTSVSKGRFNVHDSESEEEEQEQEHERLPPAAPTVVVTSSKTSPPKTNTKEAEKEKKKEEEEEEVEEIGSDELEYFSESSSDDSF